MRSELPRRACCVATSAVMADASVWDSNARTNTISTRCGSEPLVMVDGTVPASLNHLCTDCGGGAPHYAPSQNYCAGTHVTARLAMHPSRWPFVSHTCTARAPRVVVARFLTSPRPSECLLAAPSFAGCAPMPLADMRTSTLVPPPRARYSRAAVSAKTARSAHFAMSRHATLSAQRVFVLWASIASCGAHGLAPAIC